MIRVTIPDGVRNGARSAAVLTLTTRGVPRGDQQDFWESAVREHFFAIDGTNPAPRKHGFLGRMDRLVFGGLRLDRVVAQPYRVVRSGRLTRQAPSEALLMFVLRHGEMFVAQDERIASLRKPYTFALVDSAKPYDAELVTSSEVTMIQIPRAWPGPYLRGLVARTATPLMGRNGLGALAVSTLLALRRHVADRDDAVAHVAAKNAVELAIAAVLEELGSAQELRGSRAAVLEQAQRFMLDRLAEPELSPAHIAAAIPVSERYLFSIFRDVGTTPAEWLRCARLERASTLLTSDTIQSTVTIQQIACSVGLPHASHFSRVFRDHFGVSPSEYRAAGSSHRTERADSATVTSKPHEGCVTPAEDVVRSTDRGVHLRSPRW
ncbi:helix-turn-helix domain-containing protein [Prauserella salsuginis]|uniref:helix-turn-helix domain-containing protein n=1 Tax=Prauserella salsuginis TaxID=387889 RepID=UPI0021643C58|nr:helix-turn-helix domain-containing protein [Prauserella salsuginis]